MTRAGWTAWGILSAVLLASCSETGPSSGTCEPANCTGCCHSSGLCVLKMSELSCGTAGSPCATCKVGESCQQGVCVPNPTGNCAGCWLGTQCVDGSSPGACGKGGVPCRACQPATEKCNPLGQCVSASCQCRPDQCCASGGCLPGTAHPACGRGGFCAACKVGEQCIEQQCVASACNATSCPTGCCTKEGPCEVEPSNASCGKAGQPCVACSATEQCNLVTGQCEPRPVPSCVTTPCTTGCCDATTGVCQAGTTDQACGYLADQCHRCSLGQRCVDHECRCDPASCQGCCLPDQTCVTGTDNSGCGKGGLACSLCLAPTNCSAVSGQCEPPATCNTTCLTGCCTKQGVCVDGDQPSQCGNYGMPCFDCTANGTDWFCAAATKTCSPPATSCTTAGCPDGFLCDSGSGKCSVDPTGHWTLQIISAEIAGSPKVCTQPSDCPDNLCPFDASLQAAWGLAGNRCKATKCWGYGTTPSDLSCPPNTAVQIQQAQTWSTKVIGQTWWPKWNQDIFTATAAEFMSGSVILRMVDDRDYWQNLIASCPVAFEDWEFEYDWIEWSYPCNDGDVVYLNYSFKYTPPAPPARPNVWIVGDSLAVGAGPPTQSQTAASYDVTLRAKTGAPIDDRYPEVQNAVAATADAIIIQAGINDVGGGTANVSELTKDISRTLDATQGTRCVFWVTYQSQFTGTYAKLNGPAPILNQIIRSEVAKRPSWAGLIDFQPYIDAHPELNAPDGLHLTSTGYQQLAGFYVAALKSCFGF